MATDPEDVPLTAKSEKPDRLPPTERKTGHVSKALEIIDGLRTRSAELKRSSNQAGTEIQDGLSQIQRNATSRADERTPRDRSILEGVYHLVQTTRTSLENMGTNIARLEPDQTGARGTIQTLLEDAISEPDSARASELLNQAMGVFNQVCESGTDRVRIQREQQGRIERVGEEQAQSAHLVALRVRDIIIDNFGEKAWQECLPYHNDINSRRLTQRVSELIGRNSPLSRAEQDYLTQILNSRVGFQHLLASLRGEVIQDIKAAQEAKPAKEEAGQIDAKQPAPVEAIVYPPLNENPVIQAELAQIPQGVDDVTSEQLNGSIFDRFIVEHPNKAAYYRQQGEPNILAADERHKAKVKEAESAGLANARETIAQVAAEDEGLQSPDGDASPEPENIQPRKGGKRATAREPASAKARRRRPARSAASASAKPATGSVPTDLDSGTGAGLPPPAGGGESPVEPVESSPVEKVELTGAERLARSAEILQTVAQTISTSPEALTDQAANEFLNQFSAILGETGKMVEDSDEWRAKSLEQKFTRVGYALGYHLENEARVSYRLQSVSPELDRFLNRSLWTALNRLRGSNTPPYDNPLQITRRNRDSTELVSANVYTFAEDRIGKALFDSQYAQAAREVPQDDPGAVQAERDRQARREFYLHAYQDSQRRLPGWVEPLPPPSESTRQSAADQLVWLTDALQRAGQTASNPGRYVTLRERPTDRFNAAIPVELGFPELGWSSFPHIDLLGQYATRVGSDPKLTEQVAAAWVDSGVAKVMDDLEVTWWLNSSFKPIRVLARAIQARRALQDSTGGKVAQPVAEVPKSLVAADTRVTGGDTQGQPEPNRLDQPAASIGTPSGGEAGKSEKLDAAAGDGDSSKLPEQPPLTPPGSPETPGDGNPLEQLQVVDKKLQELAGILGFGSRRSVAVSDARYSISERLRKGESLTPGQEEFQRLLGEQKRLFDLAYRQPTTPGVPTVSEGGTSPDQGIQPGSAAPEVALSTGQTTQLGIFGVEAPAAVPTEDETAASAPVARTEGVMPAEPPQTEQLGAAVAVESSSGGAAEGGETVSEAQRAAESSPLVEARRRGDFIERVLAVIEPGKGDPLPLTPQIAEEQIRWIIDKVIEARQEVSSTGVVEDSEEYPERVFEEIAQLIGLRSPTFGDAGVATPNSLVGMRALSEVVDEYGQTIFEADQDAWRGLATYVNSTGVPQLLNQLFPAARFQPKALGEESTGKARAGGSEPSAEHPIDGGGLSNTGDGSPGGTPDRGGKMDRLEADLEDERRARESSAGERRNNPEFPAGMRVHIQGEASLTGATIIVSPENDQQDNNRFVRVTVTDGAGAREYFIPTAFVSGEPLRGEPRYLNIADSAGMAVEGVEGNVINFDKGTKLMLDEADPRLQLMSAEPQPLKAGDLVYSLDSPLPLTVEGFDSDQTIYASLYDITGTPQSYAFQAGNILRVPDLNSSQHVVSKAEGQQIVSRQSKKMAANLTKVPGFSRALALQRDIQKIEGVTAAKAVGFEGGVLGLDVKTDNTLDPIYLVKRITTMPGRRFGTASDELQLEVEARLEETREQRPAYQAKVVKTEQSVVARGDMFDDTEEERTESTLREIARKLDLEPSGSFTTGDFEALKTILNIPDSDPEIGNWAIATDGLKRSLIARAVALGVASLPVDDPQRQTWSGNSRFWRALVGGNDRFLDLARQVLGPDLSGQTLPPGETGVASGSPTGGPDRFNQVAVGGEVAQVAGEGGSPLTEAEIEQAEAERRLQNEKFVAEIPFVVAVARSVDRPEELLQALVNTNFPDSDRTAFYAIVSNEVLALPADQQIRTENERIEREVAGRVIEASKDLPEPKPEVVEFHRLIQAVQGNTFLEREANSRVAAEALNNGLPPHLRATVTAIRFGYREFQVNDPVVPYPPISTEPAEPSTDKPLAGALVDNPAVVSLSESIRRINSRDTAQPVYQAIFQAYREGLPSAMYYRLLLQAENALVQREETTTILGVVQRENYEEARQAIDNLNLAPDADPNYSDLSANISSLTLPAELKRALTDVFKTKAYMLRFHPEAEETAQGSGQPGEVGAGVPVEGLQATEATGSERVVTLDTSASDEPGGGETKAPERVEDITDVDRLIALNSGRSNLWTSEVTSHLGETIGQLVTERQRVFDIASEAFATQGITDPLQVRLPFLVLGTREIDHDNGGRLKVNIEQISLIDGLEVGDFVVDEKSKNLILTASGIQKQNALIAASGRSLVYRGVVHPDNVRYPFDNRSACVSRAEREQLRALRGPAEVSSDGLKALALEPGLLVINPEPTQGDNRVEMATSYNLVDEVALMQSSYNLGTRAWEPRPGLAWGAQSGVNPLDLSRLRSVATSPETLAATVVPVGSATSPEPRRDNVTGAPTAEASAGESLASTAGGAGQPPESGPPIVARAPENDPNRGARERAEAEARGLSEWTSARLELEQAVGSFGFDDIRTAGESLMTGGVPVKVAADSKTQALINVFNEEHRVLTRLTPAQVARIPDSDFNRWMLARMDPKGVPPDATALTALVDACLLRGDVVLARKTLGTVLPSSPDAYPRFNKELEPAYVRLNESVERAEEARREGIIRGRVMGRAETNRLQQANHDRQRIEAAIAEVRRQFSPAPPPTGSSGVETPEGEDSPVAAAREAVETPRQTQEIREWWSLPELVDAQRTREEAVQQAAETQAAASAEGQLGSPVPVPAAREAGQRRRPPVGTVRLRRGRRVEATAATGENSRRPGVRREKDEVPTLLVPLVPATEPGRTTSSEFSPAQLRAFRQAFATEARLALGPSEATLLDALGSLEARQINDQVRWITDTILGATQAATNSTGEIDGTRLMTELSTRLGVGGGSGFSPEQTGVAVIRVLRAAEASNVEIPREIDQQLKEAGAWQKIGESIPGYREFIDSNVDLRVALEGTGFRDLVGNLESLYAQLRIAQGEQWRQEQAAREQEERALQADFAKRAGQVIQTRVALGGSEGGTARHLNDSIPNIDTGPEHAIKALAWFQQKATQAVSETLTGEQVNLHQLAESLGLNTPEVQALSDDQLLRAIISVVEQHRTNASEENRNNFINQTNQEGVWSRVAESVASAPHRQGSLEVTFDSLRNFTDQMEGPNAQPVQSQQRVEARSLNREGRIAFALGSQEQGLENTVDISILKRIEEAGSPPPIENPSQNWFGRRWQSLRQALSWGSLQRFGFRSAEEYYRQTWKKQEIQDLRNANFAATSANTSEAARIAMQRVHQEGRDVANRFISQSEGKIKLKGEQEDVLQAGTLRTFLVAEVIKPQVEAIRSELQAGRAITPELTERLEKELQRKLRDYVRTHQNDTQVSEYFGPGAVGFDRVSEVFASNILDMSKTVAEDSIISDEVLTNLDNLAEIKLFKARFVHETRFQKKISQNLADWLVAKAESSRIAGNFLRPGIIGALVATGAFVASQPKTVAATAMAATSMTIPIISVLAGVSWGVMRRNFEANRRFADLQARLETDQDVVVPQNAESADQRLLQIAAGNMTSMRELRDGGGQDLVTKQDRRPLQTLLQELENQANPAASEQAAHELVQRYAEIQARLDFPANEIQLGIASRGWKKLVRDRAVSTQGRGVLRYGAEEGKEGGKLQLVRDMVEIRQRLFAGGMTEERFNEALNDTTTGVLVLANKALTQSAEIQKRNFSKYKIGASVKFRNRQQGESVLETGRGVVTVAGVTGAITGLAGGLIGQEMMAQVARHLVPDWLSDAPVLSFFLRKGQTRLESYLAATAKAVGRPELASTLSGGDLTKMGTGLLKNVYEHPRNIPIGDRQVMAVGPDRAVSVLDEEGRKIPLPPIHLEQNGHLVISGAMTPEAVAKLPSSVQKLISAGWTTKESLDPQFNLQEHFKSVLNKTNGDEIFIHGRAIIHAKNGEMSIDYQRDDGQFIRLHGVTTLNNGVANIRFDPTNPANGLVRTINGIGNVIAPLGQNDWQEVNANLGREGWGVDQFTIPGVPVEVDHVNELLNLGPDKLKSLKGVIETSQFPRQGIPHQLYPGNPSGNELSMHLAKFRNWPGEAGTLKFDGRIDGGVINSHIGLPGKTDNLLNNLIRTTRESMGRELKYSDFVYVVKTVHGEITIPMNDAGLAQLPKELLDATGQPRGIEQIAVALIQKGPNEPIIPGSQMLSSGKWPDKTIMHWIASERFNTGSYREIIQGQNHSGFRLIPGQATELIPPSTSDAPAGGDELAPPPIIPFPFARRVREERLQRNEPIAPVEQSALPPIRPITPAPLPAVDTNNPDELRQTIRQFALEHPDRVAAIMSDWLREPATAVETRTQATGTRVETTSTYSTPQSAAIHGWYDQDTKDVFIVTKDGKSFKLKPIDGNFPGERDFNIHYLITDEGPVAESDIARVYGIDNNNAEHTWYNAPEAETLDTYNNAYAAAVGANRAGEEVTVVTKDGREFVVAKEGNYIAQGIMGRRGTFKGVNGEEASIDEVAQVIGNRDGVRAILFGSGNQRRPVPQPVVLTTDLTPTQIREQVARSANTNPEALAEVLKGWLRGDRQPVVRADALSTSPPGASATSSSGPVEPLNSTAQIPGDGRGSRLDITLPQIPPLPPVEPLASASLTGGSLLTPVSPAPSTRVAALDTTPPEEEWRSLSSLLAESNPSASGGGIAAARSNRPNAPTGGGSIGSPAARPAIQVSPPPVTPFPTAVKTQEPANKPQETRPAIPAPIEIRPGRDVLDQVSTALRSSSLREQAFTSDPTVLLQGVLRKVELPMNAKLNVTPVIRNGKMYVSGNVSAKPNIPFAPAMTLDLNVVLENSPGGLRVISAPPDLGLLGMIPGLEEKVRATIQNLNITIVNSVNRFIPFQWRVDSFQIEGDHLAMNFRRQN